ncbi:MAG: glycosyltransferase family 1 protein [Gemmatimonadota bacterium]|nr:MAG: glycosyltransferase family 1 protein [Gemmatimonadota bacterium]
MNITIVTIGSRGDVQPYVALGVGLERAGFHVRIATHTNFRSTIERHSLNFAEIPGDPRQMIESDAGQAWLNSGRNPFRFAGRMASLMRPFTESAIRSCLQACRDASLIVYSMLGWLVTHHVSEKLGIPALPAYLQPATPTREFHLMGWRGGSIGGLANLMMYLGGEQLFWMYFRRPLNAARRDVLGLPPMPFRAPYAGERRRGNPVLYGYSPTLLPKPPDWADNVHVTGSWFTEPDAEWRPPPELTEFLNAGAPPVCVGFGSLHTRNATKQTQCVVEALTRAGQRGILLTGWGALTDADLPEHVFAVSSVPHDWLFPRTAAVVHHCGSGTTAAGLRAGVPAVPIPFFGDQPFWARCLYDRGVAVKPIPGKRLSVKHLAEAIRYAASDTALNERAATMGERVRSEDGVGRAVEVIERFVRSQ